MKTKQKLGQFFSTNVDYIFTGFETFVENKKVYDPFAGNCDLLNWALKNKAKSIKGSDVDKKFVNDIVFLNDSLKEIPTSEFIITNPPYLAKNKMGKKDKELYLKNSEFEDKYALALAKIVESNQPEGIIIVPINFIVAENSNSIRKLFFEKYQIIKLKYFTTQVFDDTSYNVIAFYFKQSKINNKKITIQVFPENIIRTMELNDDYNLKNETIEKIKNQKNIINCRRIIETDLVSGNNIIKCAYNDFSTPKEYRVDNKTKTILEKNILLLNCIDKKEEKISIEDISNYKVKSLIGKITSRNMASVSVDIDVDTQKKLIPLVNDLLNKLREETFSMFLTNFRDGNRKRISFDFFYRIICYCYEQYILKKQ